MIFIKSFFSTFFYNFNNFRKFLTISSIYLLFISFLFAQDQVPSIFISQPVENLFWSHDSSVFFYSDGNEIFARDVSVLDKVDFPISQRASIFSGDIKKLFASKNPNNPNDSLILVICQNGIIEYTYACDFSKKYYIQDNKKDLATAYALSNSGNYIAVAYSDGTLGIFSYNTSSQSYTKSEFELSKSGQIKNLNFNFEENILITNYDNGYIYLWNFLTEELLFSHPYFYNERPSGAYLSQNSQKLCFKSSSNSIDILNLENYEIETLITEGNILSFSISPDANQLLILSENNIISIYDLTSYALIGDYIPSYDTNITCFAINNNNSRFLIGHEDGRILVSDYAKRVVPISKANEYDESKVFPQYSDYEENYSTKNNQESLPDSEYADYKKTKQSSKNDITVNDMSPIKALSENEAEGKNPAYASIFRKNVNQISAKAGVFIFPSPFSLGISLGASYYNFKLLSPFYFGALGEGFFGFGNKNFPFSYQNDGTDLGNPVLTGGKVLGFFGISVYPFISNNVEFFADIGLGAEVNLLGNFSIGVFSNVYPAFSASLKVGAGINNFSAYLEANYSAITDFSFGIGFTYNFFLKNKAANQNTNKNLNQNANNIDKSEN